MSETNAKTKIFTRIAAAVLLVSSIISMTNEIVYFIIREVKYGYISLDLRVLSNNFNARTFWEFICNVLPTVLVVTGAVLLLIAAIMLFSSKLKGAGIMIIAYAAVALIDNVGYIIVYATQILPQEGKIASNYMGKQVINLLKYTGEFIIVVLLGLLLIGVFKKASKIMGFVLLGAFAAAWIIVMIDLIKRTVNFTRLISGKPELFNVFASVSGIVLVSAAGMMFIAYMLCSLGIALKPRLSAGTASDNSVTS